MASLIVTLVILASTLFSAQGDLSKSDSVWLAKGREDLAEMQNGVSSDDIILSELILERKEAPYVLERLGVPFAMREMMASTDALHWEWAYEAEEEGLAGCIVLHYYQDECSCFKVELIFYIGLDAINEENSWHEPPENFEELLENGKIEKND